VTANEIGRDPEAAAKEIERLNEQLEELRQALDAIRDGEVDAVVVGGPRGEQLYTQVNADRPYRVIVEEMGDGALTVSGRGIVLYANDRMAQLLRQPRAHLLGRAVTELVSPAVAPTLADLLTARPGATRRAELDLRGADGVLVPVLASVTGLEIEGVVVRCLIVADLTDQRRGEQVLAEAYDGLTQSSRELEEAQRIGGIGSWHWDAATDSVDWSPQMYAIMGLDPRTTGRELHERLATVSHPEDALLVTAARAQALLDHRPFTVTARVLHADGETRHTVTRGEVIVENGAVTGMRGTTQDVTEQRRAAAAVSAAHQELLCQQMALDEEHRLKETLQRAVLPASLPVGAEFRLAARYLPADQPAMVGGDWYDAFYLPDDTLALTVGDVVGHDLEAAATMGQMRNALRAYAFADGPPADILERLNRLAHGLDDGGLATAAFGLLDVRARTFRWAGAGHPPPIVIGPDGARFMPPPTVGMMLGADPGATFVDVTVPVRPGELLVLYSDGLIERRNSDLDADFAALLMAADGLAGSSPEEACVALVERLVPDGHEDDVCLLVLELLA
jgi:sigma-B regulation protein RsbU (phosphoserine phosphatase)